MPMMFTLPTGAQHIHLQPPATNTSIAGALIRPGQAGGGIVVTAPELPTRSAAPMSGGGSVPGWAWAVGGVLVVGAGGAVAWKLHKRKGK